MLTNEKEGSLCVKGVCAHEGNMHVGSICARREYDVYEGNMPKGSMHV